jgi:hypothetical protein
MTRQFVLPDLGEGLTEAEIAAVPVREGDVIQEDAPCWRWRLTGLWRSLPMGACRKIHAGSGRR